MHWKSFIRLLDAAALVYGYTSTHAIDCTTLLALILMLSISHVKLYLWGNQYKEQDGRGTARAPSPLPEGPRGTRKWTAPWLSNKGRKFNHKARVACLKELETRVACLKKSETLLNKEQLAENRNLSQPSAVQDNLETRPPLVPGCEKCGRAEEKVKCPFCEEVAYCSQTCRVQDLRGHRKQCNINQMRREAST
jgi:hypothetical protein